MIIHPKTQTRNAADAEFTFTSLNQSLSAVIRSNQLKHRTLESVFKFNLAKPRAQGITSHSKMKVHQFFKEY